MSEKPRQWGPREVAPGDATVEELSLHFLLWGDVFIRTPGAFPLDAEAKYDRTPKAPS